MTPIVGSSNNYPRSQCTWYANERYHQLAGKYVSWSANASGWLSGAQAAGWSTSSSAPAGVPSIIVLQPGVQLADAVFGHVGVVEQINGDGSVITSDLNWGPNAAARAQVSHVTFRRGPGVNFVWAGGGSISTDTRAGTTQLAATAATGSNPLSALSSFLTALGPSFSAWLGNPARIFKMVAGVLLLFVAIILLVAPEAEKVAGAAIGV